MVDRPVLDENELVRRARTLVEDSIEVKRRLLDGEHLPTLARMADAVARSIAQGGKMMLCGNGGSAADAQHLAAELLVRLRPMVNRDGVAAITLATDTSMLTACGNDYSFDDIYERTLLALGRPGDVLLGITTSGKSPNVLKALKAARARGITALGFLGGNGGPCLAECDIALVVPSTMTGRIQESHITAGHALMEMIEDLLLDRGVIKPMGA